MRVVLRLFRTDSVNVAPGGASHGSDSSKPGATCPLKSEGRTLSKPHQKQCERSFPVSRWWVLNTTRDLIQNVLHTLPLSLTCVVEDATFHNANCSKSAHRRFFLTLHNLYYIVSLYLYTTFLILYCGRAYIYLPLHRWNSIISKASVNFNCH